MRCFMDQDFGDVHVPDLPPGLIVLDATPNKKDGGSGAQLAWLPPVSEVSVGVA